MYKKLYIFIEGAHEREFFARLGERIFKDEFDDIQLIPYSQASKEWVKNLFKSIKSMNASYIWLSDLNDAPCISKRKEKLIEKFTELDENKIIIVRKEIESWYLALLDNESCKRFKISVDKFWDTDNIKKEQFDFLIPKGFVSKTAFMSEILDCASVETAKERNTSFKYFVDKYCL